MDSKNCRTSYDVEKVILYDIDARELAIPNVHNVNCRNSLGYTYKELIMNSEENRNSRRDDTG